MNFDELASNMTADIYQRLKESVELGRWPTGGELSKEQKALCLEAILKYEIAQQIPVEQRTGYLPSNSCGPANEVDTIDSINLPTGGEE
ncbi:DUF1315 family protein [Reinekea thalattae]|uniref:DUF1315 family protein n=1 Tax=Reinekea thalattae TaxID=2593301 RepID=A0A5C8ZAG3_9GAMM|nr:DUF1315 family protein [Reinekea thalattae]TXR53876.1 DUF1315 family protein [Reinekea thalattae]